MAADDFEQLFGTPHGTDLGSLCAAHGITCARWEDRLVWRRPDGPVALVAETDRTENVAVHDRLNQAVVDALARL